MKNRTENIASFTRTYRRLHKWLALPLFVFMFIIGGTGVLLGWKKMVNFTPPTLKGSTLDASHWITLDSIHTIANRFAKDSLQPSSTVDRIDVRPSKGVAKISFEADYTELQIDLTTGKTLSIKRRWNDLIEHIHDGTIIDRLISNEGEQAKVTYTTLTSIGLMLLSFSGFWLWWNPKRMRRMKGIER